MFVELNFDYLYKTTAITSSCSEFTLSFKLQTIYLNGKKIVFSLCDNTFAEFVSFCPKSQLKWKKLLLSPAHEGHHHIFFQRLKSMIKAML